MSLILKQETASSVPVPPAGKGTIFLSDSDTLTVKLANGTTQGFPTIGGSNTQVIFNDNGALNGDADFTFNKTNNTLTIANLTVTGTLDAGDIGVSSIQNGTSNVDIIGTSGNVTTSVNGNANILVVTGTGVNVAGTLNATGNTTFDNLTVTGTLIAGDVAVSSIANGTSNVDIIGVSGNVTISVAGNANVLSVTGTGIIANGTANITGNANVGNLGATGVIATTLGGSLTTASQPNVTGVGTLVNVQVGATSSTVDFPNAISITSQDNSGVSASDNIGLAAEAVANSTNTAITGIGVLGVARVVSATKATGVQGEGHVTNTSDTGAAVGIRGYATDTHAAGYNIGVLGNAMGSGTGNYAFYVQNGGIASIENDTFWDLSDNSNVSITFNSTGKANIFRVDTTDSAEGVATSGYLSVAGNANVVGNATVGGIKTDNYYYANGSPVDFQQAGGSNTQIQFNDGDQFGGSANFTFDKTTQQLLLNGNAQFVNANLGNLATANFVQGTLTTNAQPNITSVGTLSSLTVTGNVSGGNLTTAGKVVASTLESNVAIGTAPLTVTSTTKVANLNADLLDGYDTATSATANTVVVRDADGNITGNNISGTLSTASQPNITSIGTLTSLAVTGNVTSGNVYANSGTIGANIITGNTVGGSLTTNAQPNITSVGTLTSLAVTGNVAAGNLTTTGVLSVTGTGVSSIAGNLDMTSNNIINLATPVNANDAATKQYVDDIAQGLHTHDSCNAATTGTLATISGGTVTYNNGSSGVGATLTTTGSYTTIDGVTLTNGMRILVKDEANAAHNGIYDRTSSTVLTRSSDFDTPTEMAGGDFTFVTAGTLYDNTGWVMTEPVTTVGTDPVPWVQFSGAGTYTAGTGLTLTGSQFSVNASQTQITAVGTLSSLAVTGNISAGNLSATLLTGTLTTNAQPNITSVGTLSSLAVTGNITAGNLVGIFANGNSDISIPAANGNINFDVAGNANILVVTDTGVNVAGTLNATGNANVNNLGTAQVLATANITAPVLISNVSTGTAPLTVSSTTRVANLNVAYANVTDLISVADVNTGTYYPVLANAATGNVSEGSNANLTFNAATGNLSTTILNATGNVRGANVVSTSYQISSVNAAVSAAGTVQGNATALTNQINVVSTVASGAGVKLPTAVAGMRITIMNTAANALLVYPDTNGIINSAAANAAFSLGAGGRLDFVSVSTTQWYTLSATYA